MRQRYAPRESESRCHRVGIDRDHLEKFEGPDAKEPIVRAHRRTLAARHWRHAELRLDPRAALLERARRHDQVIQLHQSRVIPSSAITFFTAGRAITRCTRAE
jgi:hypothetical protein